MGLRTQQKSWAVAAAITGVEEAAPSAEVVAVWESGISNKVKPSVRNLWNLCDQPLDLKGTENITLTINVLFGASYEVNLFVILNTALKADIILSREFLYEQKLKLVYKPVDQLSLPETNLFIILSLHVREDSENDLALVINDSDIDFDLDAKQKLKTVVLETNKASVPEVDDGHAVQVWLKNSSIYAYTPRRFAHSEHLQLRAITDDLLAREIINPSVISRRHLRANVFVRLAEL